jgi:VanZ family protein
MSAMKLVHYLQNRKNYNTKLILLVVAMLILISTLAFGLAPRGSFSEDWVFWDQNSKQTRFGKFGLVTGDISELVDFSERSSSISFNFTLTPELPETNHFTVLLQLYDADDELPFIIGQWKTFFVVVQGTDYKNEGRALRLVADITNYIGQSIHMQITVGALRNSLSVNGNFLSTLESPAYSLTKNMTNLTIGNSPDGKRGWTGHIQHLEMQLQDGLDKSGKTIRNYTFNQNNLPKVHDSADYESHLVAPKPGRFPNPNLLKQIPVKQLFSGDLLTDLILNIIGFMPLGFITALLYWFYIKETYLTVGLVFTTLLLGSVVSIFIEYTQIFLPGRSSHLHDLVLNIAGQLTGLVAFGLFLKFKNLEYCRLKVRAAEHREQ